MTDPNTDVPVDQPVRDRIASEFDRNFLVEAGAGSGKTYSLATRMAAGIAAGASTVDGMAVVTFTRKAAAELRGRFQLALERLLAAHPGAAGRERLERALASMERLAAGTIHSFCARLLRERPIDARIAPGFEELSDTDDLQRRQQAWRDFVAAARAAGDPSMLDLLEAGVRPADLDAAFACVCEHEDVAFDMGAGEPPDPGPAWDAIDRLWEQLAGLRPKEFHPETTCRLQQRYDEFDGRLRLARRNRLSSMAQFLEAWGHPKVTQMYWDTKVGRAKGIGKQVQTLLTEFEVEFAEPFRVTWRAYVHRLAMAVLIAGRDDYARERRRQNVVNYVDLLRVASRMLRENAVVRRALQQKFRYLFVDEFQDTDPIQAEIFLMLAAQEDGTPAGGVDPYALALRPGALFVVGDPKQSIFRFRRADIDIYNRVAERIRATGGEVVQLTANFRSLPGVCAVANTVFPPLFSAETRPYSPAFAALDPVRSESEAPEAPRVAALTVPDLPSEEAVAEEAQRIAAYIQAEVASNRRRYRDFLILARQRPRLHAYADALDGLDIPVDVSGAGLFCDSPEVRSLAALLQSLADPLDAVSLVGVLRGPLFGHSDPDLFLYRQAGGRFELSAPLPEEGGEGLRAEGGGRGAEGGGRGAEGGGRGAEGGMGPVLESMRRLREMWLDTRRLPVAAAVARILERAGWLALAATTPGGAAAGHLLQAVDRVREVVEAGGGLAEAARALAEDAASSEAEAMPLEPGRRDVVRLMNLHKAKGLEASVVFLADAPHAYEFPVILRIVRGEGGGEARGHLRVMRPSEKPWMATPLGQPVNWCEHEAEERRYIAAERLRLLYVAGTRAKELLVVCRSEKASKNKAWDVFEPYVAGVAELDVPAPQAPPARVAVDLSPAAREAARMEREARRAALGEPSWEVASVTAAAHATLADRASQAAEPVAAPGATEEAAAAVHRVDAGAAWGTLVHGLLEHAMRRPAATRADLERLARWLTVEREDLRPVIPRALDLVERVSGAPFWAEARAAGDAHVEVPFALPLAPAGGHAAGVLNGAPGGDVQDGAPRGSAGCPLVLRGVIDLVHRAGAGWRILDYKTDLGAEDEAFMLQRHGGQLAQYRLAWEGVTGERVEALGLVPLRTLKPLWVGAGE